MPMSVDEILEAISKLEKFEDFQRIQSAASTRWDHLCHLELQKFKKLDLVKIKDKQGKYHTGMVIGFTKYLVKVEIYDKVVKVNPKDLEKQVSNSGG